MANLVGKPPKEPARNVIIRMPESLYAELMLLKSHDMLNSMGNTKYGAITGYFVTLCRRDLDHYKDEIRKANVTEAAA